MKPELTIDEVPYGFLLALDMNKQSIDPITLGVFPSEEQALEFAGIFINMLSKSIKLDNKIKTNGDANHITIPLNVFIKNEEIHLTLQQNTGIKNFHTTVNNKSGSLRCHKNLFYKLNSLLKKYNKPHFNIPHIDNN